MTEAQHTRGPWGAMGREVVADDGWKVASTSFIYRSKAEAEANGRLIAAAPDLLGALERVRSEAIPDHPGCGEEGNTNRWCCDVLDAIAKATGAGVGA